MASLVMIAALAQGSAAGLAVSFCSVVAGRLFGVSSPNSSRERRPPASIGSAQTEPGEGELLCKLVRCLAQKLFGQTLASGGRAGVGHRAVAGRQQGACCISQRHCRKWACANHTTTPIRHTPSLQAEFGDVKVVATGTVGGTPIPPAVGATGDSAAAAPEGGAAAAPEGAPISAPQAFEEDAAIGADNGAASGAEGTPVVIDPPADEEHQVGMRWCGWGG